MKNDIKTTQQLIVHMFKNNKSLCIKNSNSNKNKPNNNIVVNFKRSLITQNLNINANINKGSILNHNNNLTSRIKYKTTKNSPERLLIQKHLSRQKNFIGLNHIQKPSNKNTSNNTLNNINKMLLTNQNHNYTIRDEIIKKKIMQIKNKKNVTTINSNNNSISLSNSINYNYNYISKYRPNNSNSNISHFKNKAIFNKKNKNSINKENYKIQKKIKSYAKQPNSYREVKRRSKSNYEKEKNINNNGKNNKYEKKGKYYNLINKYISSASASSKQPVRYLNQKYIKSKFNTIAAKMAIDKYIHNSNNHTLNYHGIGNPLSENSNNGKINNMANIKKKIKYKNHNNQSIKNNFIFSSTSNSLYMPKKQMKQIPNYFFDMKAINKGSYQNKQTSRKHSSEKSAQNSINHSIIHYIINSSSTNYFVKNYNSPVITVNNSRKSEIINEKINCINNGNINYNNYSNNKKNISNGMMNNRKFRFNLGYSNSNSKERSHNNKKKFNMNKITDLKKYNVERIIHQLYKKHDKEKNVNNNNHNISNNNSINSKNFITSKREHYKIENINNSLVNNKNNSNLYSPRETKEKKDKLQIMNNNIHHIKNKSENINCNINKIKINSDKFIFSLKNKDTNPDALKNNKNLCNKVLNQNDITKRNNNDNNYGDKKNDKNYEENKKNSSNNSSINNNNKYENYIKKNKKEQNNDIKNNIINNFIDNNKNKNNINLDNNKDKEPKNKKIEKVINKFCRDKDLSCSENNNDSLLDNLNNNIDFIQNNKINYSFTELSESYESRASSSKENCKNMCYKKDMEIISDYIKKYYKKHKKYPTTKMKFYKYGRLLGKGAFGKVNLSLHILTGRLVAIKSINKEKIVSERQRQKIKTETSIMKILSKSNNIVKIFETYETKKHICIVMEYICAGDLLNYIKKRSKLQEPVAKFIFKQIILALKYIHQNNIVHRDIKLDNILIDLDNNIKICDFGVSRIVNKNDIMLEQCGTPAYIAPEILLNKGYEGFAVDVWSCGVVLYAMLSGNVPFKGADLKELNNIIISGKYQPIEDISKEASHLLRNLLEIEPSKRITIENILNHPWLLDVDLNFWKNQNLFTNAEYVLLAKSNVDYRNIANKDDMIENFDIRNLDTIDENINKNVKTKSLILAPFNTSISSDGNNESKNNCSIPLKNNNMIYNAKYQNSLNSKDITDYNNPDLKILNGVIKFIAKVKDLNRKYELNNNQEIDHGVVIMPNDSDDKVKKDYNISNSPFNRSFGKFFSKPFSPPNEVEETKNKNNKSKEGNEINENALNILQNLGYKKSVVKEYLIKNVFNYATASYRLIVKYCFS